MRFSLPRRLICSAFPVLFAATLAAQVDVGVNVAGVLYSRVIVLVEWPLDSAARWTMEAGAYYGSRAELRERTTGEVLIRDRNYGLVVDLRRYLIGGRMRAGLFAGPWLRYNREVVADRRFDPLLETRNQEISLGVLAGYKYTPTPNTFIEPVLGIGTVALRLVEPFGFGGDGVVPLTVDYALRFRAGLRF